MPALAPRNLATDFISYDPITNACTQCLYCPNTDCETQTVPAQIITDTFYNNANCTGGLTGDVDQTTNYNVASAYVTNCI